ncbi:MAG: acyloxyacyl hydrolase [Bacteroidota bacterium]
MKSNLRISIWLLSLITIFPIISSAQSDSTNKKNYTFVSVHYSNGTILPTNTFVKGENQYGSPMTKYQSASLKIGWQNPGYTNWQKVHNAPYYGVGYYIGDFYNTQEVGYPMAAYGFLGIPVKRWKKVELYTEFQFGVAFNWTHFDSITNPNNIAIGGGLTVFLDIGVNATYEVSKNIDLGVGLSFTHFSNGGFERPNRGFNVYSPSVSLKYHIGGRADVRNIEKPPKELEISNDLYFMIGYADYQINEHEFDSNYYALGGLGIYYSWQHTNAFRSGPGIDFNYAFGLTANEDGTPGPQGWDNVTIGLIYTPELVIDKLSLMGGIGIYAKHNKYGNFKQTYQRLGAKYLITENISAGINVRAINFMLAEYLEFNVGHRIRWKK